MIGLRLQGLGDPNPNDVSDFVEVCAGPYMGIGICKTWRVIGTNTAHKNYGNSTMTT
jgi:hypothetical protein